MNIAKFLGMNRDIPLPPNTTVAAAAAGSATDYEHVVFALPNLSVLAGAGEGGDSPLNAVELRLLTLVPEAGITGVVTNNFAWNLWHKRAGAVLVNTTAPTTITAGSAVVTPASMANIQPGTSLVFSGGTGAAETVSVQAVTATTFTAVFVNGHSGGYTITSAPLVSVSYAAGSNETALVPHQFVLAPGCVLMPGDVLTLARVSSNATGLASPAALVAIDYVPAQRFMGKN